MNKDLNQEKVLEAVLCIETFSLADMWRNGAEDVVAI